MKDHSHAKPTVAVVGLGKIGLTLAAVFANNGSQVIGADINPDVVKSVNRGNSHINNEPGLNQLVHTAHQHNTLSATVNTKEAAAKADIIVVIVPVLINEQNDTDYHAIDLAVEKIAQGIKHGTLVIFETTLPPGDTRNRFGNRIAEVSGLQLGTDFHLAYSPERVYSNRILKDLQRYPKIVGGITPASLEMAADFYQSVLNCKLIRVSSLETAEFAKIAECVYRDVNIALANELALFAEEKAVQITEVIHASNSQPYSHIHNPGIGVGGHCIPIYPYFFINKGLRHGLTPMSRQINDSMAAFAIQKIKKRMESLARKNVLILGLSYRENVKEPTKSTSLLLIEQLKDLHANVFVHDPQFSVKEIGKYGVTPVALNDPILSEIDVIILQAYHQEYEQLDFQQFTSCQLFFDGRNQLNQQVITTLGIKYEGIGNSNTNMVADDDAQ